MKKINKKILSIDHDDDDVDLKTFNDNLDSFVESQKNILAKEIHENGERQLREIYLRKKRKEPLKNEKISFIIKKSDQYTSQELNNYDYRSICDIYNDVKFQNRNFLKKFIDFLFFNK